MGKKRSAETKLKIGIASRKRVTSLETRKKISEASKRRKHSVETRAKISEANRKRVVTDETSHTHLCMNIHFLLPILII